MNPSSRPPAVHIMRNLGLEPDPWQVELLERDYPRVLLNCCRQAGKSTAVAILGLVEALSQPYSKILLLSRSLRQSQNLFDIVVDFYRRLGSPVQLRLTASQLQLTNHSRIVCLPCREETIRGYSHVSLLIIDEAARVPEDLFRAVSPMLAVSNGRMICLSTPYGKRGFFYKAWAQGGDDWARIQVPVTLIPRITPEFLDRERRNMGLSYFRQEYECSFEALEGLVYPDFARCVVPGPAPDGKKVGGIDFGFRNPFAAVWGVLDRDGVLWLTGEHYERQRPLSHHARRLPRAVTWYADPSGATEIAELRCADFVVRKGANALTVGIAAVTARYLSGTLKVVAGSCPNLLAEAELYRYGDNADDCGPEEPADEHNHALGALRYLICRLDSRRMARGPAAGQASAPGAPPDGPPPKPTRKPWLRYDNEELWTRVWPM